MRTASEAKAGPGVVGKSLLVVVMMREGGAEGTAAVDQVLTIVDSVGQKGLDDWIEKNLKSVKKSAGQSKSKKKAKGKPGKKKHKAKGKAPGKSHGAHGK